MSNLSEVFELELCNDEHTSTTTKHTTTATLFLVGLQEEISTLH